MISLEPRKFDESVTYQAYEPSNVYKCNINDLEQIINQVTQSNTSERILVELPNTIGLTHSIIDRLPSNIEVRIDGGLTEEYAKSVRNEHMDYLREKATYSKEELDAIITKIESIEKNIDPNWNQYEKALYLYEYMKADIVYREPQDVGDIASTYQRTRTWDTLTGLTNQLSTCNGYAHIYTELCTRQGIDCSQVASHKHAWNIITIDDKNFLVDIIWDSMDYEKGINETNNFGNKPLKYHTPRCYVEKSNNLSFLNQDWVKQASEKVSKNIPKEKMVQEKLEQFAKSRELDRQRMMYLRQQQLQAVNSNEMQEEITMEGRTR